MKLEEKSRTLIAFEKSHKKACAKPNGHTKAKIKVMIEPVFFVSVLLIFCLCFCLCFDRFLFVFLLMFCLSFCL